MQEITISIVLLHVVQHRIQLALESLNLKGVPTIFDAFNIIVKSLGGQKFRRLKLETFRENPKTFIMERISKIWSQLTRLSPCTEISENFSFFRYSQAEMLFFSPMKFLGN